MTQHYTLGIVARLFYQPLGPASFGDVAENEDDSGDFTASIFDWGGAVISRPFRAVLGEEDGVVRQSNDNAIAQRSPALLSFTPRSDHAGQQRGACPLHGSTRDTARCFSVNTNSHTFHCFKCNRSGNALDLWAAANRLSIYDAAIDLCQCLNVPLPTLTPPNTANREEATVATASSTCTIP